MHESQLAIVTMLSQKADRDLKSQIHIPLLCVKDIEFCQLLTDIVTVQSISVFPAIVFQPQGAGDLIVEIIQVNTSIHPAFEQTGILPIVF